jgi:hypothetical protein
MAQELRDTPIALEPAGGESLPELDRRRRMPEPLPVRLVSVADVRLPATAGLERQLDAFYVGLLGFEREGVARKPKVQLDPTRSTNHQLVISSSADAGPRDVKASKSGRDAAGDAPDDPAGAAGVEIVGPVYAAENFRLHFELFEGLVVREALRPLGIEVPSLAEAEAKLVEAEVEFTRQRGLFVGEETLFLLDPAGTWIEIYEMRPVT